MIKSKRRKLLDIYLLSDLIAISGSFWLTFWLRFKSSVFLSPKGVPQPEDYFILLPIFIIIQIFFLSRRQFYKISLRRNRLDDFFQIIITSLFTSILALLIISYLKSYNFIALEISHLFVIIYFFCSIIVIFSLRQIIFFIFRKTVFQNRGFSKIVIAGYNPIGRTIAETLSKYKHYGIEITGYIDLKKDSEEILGTFSEFRQLAKKMQITDLFIALPLTRYRVIVDLIEEANNNFIDVRIVPDFLQLAAVNVAMEHLEGFPVINLGATPLEGWSALLKRAIDISVALCGLIILAPFFSIIALLIKLESKGTVFYKQKRIGLDGKVFEMIKFRTMISDAEKQTGPIWSPPNDPRITKLGRFLRRFSIDELPQLFNVLKGEMSLVGPRPERPEFVNQFKESIPRYMLRHRVKTGMTGWAQVHGLRGNTPLDKRIEYDLYYIQNWSLILDLEILFRTIVKLKFIDRQEEDEKR